MSGGSLFALDVTDSHYGDGQSHPYRTCKDTRDQKSPYLTLVDM